MRNGWTALALAAAALPSQALTCDELRDQIAQKFRTHGRPDVQLRVVDAASAASAAGRVVGSCDRGARRIVHLGGAAAPLPDAPKSDASTGDDVVTECRDGRVLRGGASCRR